MPQPSAPELTGRALQRICFGERSADQYRGEKFFRDSFDPVRWARLARSCYWSPDGSSASAQHSADAISLAAGQRLSGDAYFNAFFAAHWRTLTTIASLGLRAVVAGHAVLRILGHRLDGSVETLAETRTDPDRAGIVELTLDERWRSPEVLRLSLALEALGPMTLLGGEWFTRDPSPGPTSVAVVTTTYGRPAFARHTVATLLADPDVAGVLHRILLIEQSEKPELGDLDGDLCTWIAQPNYGCAGGMARGIAECAEGGACAGATHILLLDDDILMEPDSVLRAARLAEYAVRDVMLGGGMLDLFQPNRIVALGESLRRNEDGYFSIEQAYPGADISRPASLDFASLPRPEGYCAWWFCFFPRTLIDRIGLPWPGFLRWDDINFGVRAAAAGVSSFPAPGVGVWHVPFYSKTAAWTSYFDKYNELIQNGLLDPAAAAVYFDRVVREARDAAGRGAFGLAAALTLACEHYAAGWDHYRSRVFPDALRAVRAFISAHEDPGITALAKDSLLQRLDLAVLRRSVSPDVAAAFAANLPATYTLQSWRTYFESGSLAPEPAPAA